MASSASRLCSADSMPVVSCSRIWTVVRWPSTVAIKAATSWLMGAPSGRSGVMRRELHWNWSSAKAGVAFEVGAGVSLETEL